MPKGQKTRVAYITDWDMCPVCGYTCQNFKDLKIQKKMIRIHMTKEHGITEFGESAVYNKAWFPDKNETFSSMLSKILQNDHTSDVPAK